MNIRELYETIDASYDDVLLRFGSDKYVEMFVKKFPNDKSMELLLNAVENQKIEESFRAAHTLKGVAGNLGFTRLFELSAILTNQLRSLTEQADGEMIEAVKAEYNKTLEAIKELV